MMMPGDFRAVVVRGLEERSVVVAREELQAYGKCTFNVHYLTKPRLGYRKEIALYAHYQSPADASRALTHKFVKFSNHSVRIHVPKEQNRNKFCLVIDWPRRYRRDHSCVNFKDKEFVSSNVRLDVLANQLKLMNSMSITQLYYTFVHDTCTIRVSRMTTHTTEEQIRCPLEAHVPVLEDTEFDIHFIYEEAFEETEERYHMQRQCLDQTLAHFAPKSKYYIDFGFPQPRQTRYKAFIYVDDSTTCLRMFEELKILEAEGGSDDESDDSSDESDGEFCVSSSGDESDDDEDTNYGDSESETNESGSDDDFVDQEWIKYSVQMSLSSTVRYTPWVFSVIMPSVKEVSNHFSKHEKPVQIQYDRQDKRGNTFVSISASDMDVFTEAKEALRVAVAPEIITFPDVSESQYVCTTNFKRVLKEIQANTETYIKINSSSLSVSTITVHGTREKRELAKQDIEYHLWSVMQDGFECFEVKLREHGPGLMKHLVLQYGPDLSRLSNDIEGIKATRLNPKRQILTLFATKSAYDLFVQSLEQFKPNVLIRQAASLSLAKEASTHECCVCFEAHDSNLKKTFFYRLEYCGHIYCRECIEQQLESSTIEFPVTCAADGCGEELVWRDFENLFADKVKSLGDITAASLKSYIAMNSDKVHNCITPDCEMVYVVSDGNNKRFVCRHCGVNICTCCHTTWHEGYDTCNAYQKRSSAGDAEFQEWMEKDEVNCKKCPKCSVPIEKNRGCKHVRCSQCRIHICWVCMKKFKSSKECYNHIASKCGGIFDD